jgi:hypothetical protein
LIDAPATSLYANDSRTPLASFNREPPQTAISPGAQLPAPHGQHVAFRVVITVNGSAPVEMRTPFIGVI